MPTVAIVVRPVIKLGEGRTIEVSSLRGGPRGNKVPTVTERTVEGIVYMVNVCFHDPPVTSVSLLYAT